jgi:hypothetical protein
MPLTLKGFEVIDEEMALEGMEAERKGSPER